MKTHAQNREQNYIKMYSKRRNGITSTLDSFLLKSVRKNENIFF